MRNAILLLAAVMLLCGTALAIECPMCGAKNLDGAKVCEECKAVFPPPKPVVPPKPVPPVRPKPATKPAAPVVKPAPKPVTPEPAEETSDELPPELQPGYRPPGKIEPVTVPPPAAVEGNEEDRVPDGLTFDPKTYSSQRGAVTFGDVDDVAVGKAIKAGAAFLWTQQRANGSWDAYGEPADLKGKENFNFQAAGPTALAVTALLESGVKVDDERMKKALTWLSKQNEYHTYSLGLRALAYSTAYRKAAGDTRGGLWKLLKADVDRLVAFSTGGMYDYYCSPKRTLGRWDNSNSQYGVLGVWAAAQVGMEVPEKYWVNVAGHWARTQNADGGWGYCWRWPQAKPSKGTMTVAGLATMMVCYEQLMASKFITCGVPSTEAGRMESGLKWLITNFGQPGVVAGAIGLAGVENWSYYYWYGVERVGLASGMKYFGTVDWYKDGTKRLMGGGQGQWGALHDTCFVMLFLTRGRNPVIFNHLQYKGTWNNRPQALATLTRWLSDNFEHTIGWQNINVDVPVAEWHDAPILVITGSTKPEFTQPQLDKLRDYVNQGGVIFSMAECGGKEFDTGMREIYRKIFPRYELARAGAKHDIYTARSGFDVSVELPIHIMSNGMRPLVIHTDQDWAKAWQARQTQSGRVFFELGGNLVHYIMLDTKSMANPRGLSPWPADAALPAGGGKIARLKHPGNCDPEPLAFKRFALLMRMRDGIAVEPVGPIDVAELPASGARLAVLSSTGSINLSDADVATLKNYVTNGDGTLLIEASGGGEAFQKSAMALVSKMFPDQTAQMLPPAHRLYQTGLKIKSVAYRQKTIRRLGRADAPRLFGVSVDGKVRVLISYEDITGGLLGLTHSTIDGYRPQSAHAVMRNIVAYAHATGKDPKTR